MRRAFAALSAAALLLTACVIEETPPEYYVDAPGECPAGRYTTLIGQPSYVLRTLNTESEIRVISWGDSSDKSYHANRMTVTLDKNDRIASVGCY